MLVGLKHNIVENDTRCRVDENAVCPFALSLSWTCNKSGELPLCLATIMPTIIIIHSSKYRVLFRFISSRCMGRYSDVQYFPIHVLSRYFFFQNVHSCQFWSAANIFPFISMPIWMYELLLISDLQNRIPPDSGVRADNRTRRGEVSLFLIFFSDLMSDVFCIDITLLVL